MKSLLFALPVIALSTAAMAESGGMPPYTLDPGPHAGNWEATLSGAGQSDDDFNDADFGVIGSIGYYFSKNVLVTFKQGLTFSGQGSSDTFNARSVFQGAYQWDLGRWQPYLGLNLGGIYGANINDDGVVGPEAGLKYYVNESTFMFGNIAYETLIDNCCTNGNIPYALGIGFNF